MTQNIIRQQKSLRHSILLRQTLIGQQILLKSFAKIRRYTMRLLKVFQSLMEEIRRELLILYQVFSRMPLLFLLMMLLVTITLLTTMNGMSIITRQKNVFRLTQIFLIESQRVVYHQRHLILHLLVQVLVSRCSCVIWLQTVCLKVKTYCILLWRWPRNALQNVQMRT